MSIQALSQAFKLDVKPSLKKFVLMCFANYTTEYGTTWCSNETLMQMTGMDTKTVNKWTRELEADGVLMDTGKRGGTTGKIKVYKIVLSETHPKTEVLPNTPKNGESIPPIFPDNTPKNGESPTPPNIDKPKGTIKGTKRKNVISLKDWESTHGELTITNVTPWAKKNGYDLTKLTRLIGEFKLKMLARDARYADFKLAFYDHFVSGWLSIKPEQCKAPVQSNLSFDDRGQHL